MADKRRHFRIYPDDDEPVEIQIMGTGFLDVLYARDISEQGIGILVPYHFEGVDIDQPVDLIISLPHYHSFKAVGHIRHSNAELTKKGIYGVELTDVGTDDADAIKKYVRTMQKKARDNN